MELNFTSLIEGKEYYYLTFRQGHEYMTTSFF